MGYTLPIDVLQTKLFKQPEEKPEVTVSQSERSELTVVGCSDAKGVENLSKPKPADPELKNPRSGILQVVDSAVVSPKDQSSGVPGKDGLGVVKNRDLVGQMGRYCGRIYPSDRDMLSWPASVAERWKKLNRGKSSNELAILSWNVNGRLDLRGCRESLLRRWAVRGFVDLGVIQEHFKKEGAALFDLFGPAWWNLSSGAVGGSKGRRSGGCAIFGQPSLVTDQGFQHEGGRICGLFVSGGLLLSIYFPTRRPNQSVDGYREMFGAFVDELIRVVDARIADRHVSWMACGADLNAHFAGCGLPPRRKDDYAARELRRFMSRFNFVSLALELCPDPRA